jgi:predicted dehydrogenase
VSGAAPRAPRVGILGARRRHQGLGPFVARHLAAAGAKVACFAGTRAETVAEARAELLRELGSAPTGYSDARRMLAAERLDALAVLTPVEHHAEGLELALEHGLAALCEKPLVWGDAAALARGRGFVDAFRARGLLLVENCQWPYTLPAFEALHPGALARPPQRFEMHLSPASTGERMLVDALPHFLSLLQALSGAPEAAIADVRFSTREPEASALDLALVWKARGGAIDASFALRTSDRLPRAAGYAIDGRSAERRVSLPHYTQMFADAAREVPLPDPLALLVADFVARLRGGRADPAEPARIVFRLEALERIVRAFRGGA